MSISPLLGCKTIESYTSVIEGKSHEADPFSYPEVKPRYDGSSWIPGKWIEIPTSRSKYFHNIHSALILGSRVYKFQFGIDVEGVSWGRLTERIANPPWFERLEDFYNGLSGFINESAPKSVPEFTPTTYHTIVQISDTVSQLITDKKRTRHEAMCGAISSIKRKVKAISSFTLSKMNKNLRNEGFAIETMATIVACFGLVYANNDLVFEPSLVMQLAHDYDMIVKGYVPVGASYHFAHASQVLY